MSNKCMISKKPSGRKISVAPPIRKNQCENQITQNNNSLDKNQFLSTLNYKTRNMSQGNLTSTNSPAKNMPNRISTLNSFGGKYVPNARLKLSESQLGNRSSSSQIRRTNTITSFSSDNYDKDIWVPDFNPNTKFFINISQCNDEVLKRVPTATISNSKYKRVSTCSTIRFSKNNTISKNKTLQPIVEDSEKDEEERRALLDVQLYWNNHSEEDVSKKVNEISSLVKENGKICGKEWIDIPFNVLGFVKPTEYNKILFIYENNQEFLIKNSKIINNIAEKATELEQWFIKIIKERPKDKRQILKWNKEQIYILKYNRSMYCNKTLVNHLGEISLKYTISQFLTNINIKRLAKKEGIVL